MTERIDLPEILRPVYFDFHWSQKKLWCLELQVVEMNISNFLWLLDYPVWATNPPANIFDLRPLTVLEDIESFPAKKVRINNADLSFPIHVMFWKERWVILDGFHRLLKIILQKQTMIAVKIVPQTLIPSLLPNPEEPTGFLKYQKSETSR